MTARLSSLLLFALSCPLLCSPPSHVSTSPYSSPNSLNLPDYPLLPCCQRSTRVTTALPQQPSLEERERERQRRERGRGGREGERERGREGERERGRDLATYEGMSLAKPCPSMFGPATKPRRERGERGGEGGEGGGEEGEGGGEGGKERVSRGEGRNK